MIITGVCTRDLDLDESTHTTTAAEAEAVTQMAAMSLTAAPEQGHLRTRAAATSRAECFVQKYFLRTEDPATLNK